jgi:hypothetical protein
MEAFGGAQPGGPSFPARIRAQVTRTLEPARSSLTRTLAQARTSLTHTLAPARSWIAGARARLGPVRTWWVIMRSLAVRAGAELRQGFPVGFAETIAWVRDRSRGLADRFVALGVTTLILIELYAAIVIRIFAASSFASSLSAPGLAVRLLVASAAVSGIALQQLRKQSASTGGSSIRWAWAVGSLVAAFVAVVGATMVTAAIVWVVTFVVFIIVQLVMLIVIVVGLLMLMGMVGEAIKRPYPIASFLLQAPAEVVLWVVATVAGILVSVVRARRS